MKTLVHVTADHIKRGEAQNCLRCPVALAVLDAISNATDVEAFEDTITIGLPGATWQADTPPAAWSFISAFDLGDPVAPFDFTLTWRVMEDPEDLS